MAELKRSTPRPFNATALLVRIAGCSGSATRPSSYCATAPVYFVIASSDAFALLAAFPSQKLVSRLEGACDYLVCFANLFVGCFDFGILFHQLFVLRFVSRALAAAATTTGAAGGLARPPPPALISSSVGLFPSPGLTTISTGSRPGLAPSAQFGDAVGWLRKDSVRPHKWNSSKHKLAFLFVFVLYLPFISGRKTSIWASPEEPLAVFLLHHDLATQFADLRESGHRSDAMRTAAANSVKVFANHRNISFIVCRTAKPKGARTMRRH